MHQLKGMAVYKTNKRSINTQMLNYWAKIKHNLIRLNYLIKTNILNHLNDKRNLRLTIKNKS